MLLAIDARNSSLSMGFRIGEAWASIGRLGLAPERTADEYALFFEAAWERARKAGKEEAPRGGVTEAWLSSVVPSQTPRIVRAVEMAFGVAATVVGPGVRTGIKIRTDFPSEVGADLVCAAVAAREALGSPCLVVNFGSVLSISAVDAAGDFVGAAFAPGIEAAAGSLRSLAAQIPEVRLIKPERAIGRSTVQSVQAGVVLGYGGLVSRLVDLMSRELLDGPGRVAVVGSGSDEGRALMEAEGLGDFIPDLVLEGLALISARPGLSTPHGRA
jgi:type III pantothenate kinase